MNISQLFIQKNVRHVYLVELPIGKGLFIFEQGIGVIG